MPLVKDLWASDNWWSHSRNRNSTFPSLPVLRRVPHLDDFYPSWPDAVGKQVVLVDDELAHAGYHFASEEGVGSQDLRL